MNIEELRTNWKSEEAAAHIHGWDFSHIHGRYTEETDLPWDYERIIRKYLKPTYSILDIDTGGGEFLLNLNHPHNRTSATEAYPPNVELCTEKLLPLGIDFREEIDYCNLSFADNSFDIVINRHGSYEVPELKRILKPGGLFITEQVGELNDYDLIQLLLPGSPATYKGWSLEKNIREFETHEFELLEQEEAFRPIRFYDIGALVWFAGIIEWEFIGFSVDRCFENLCKAQKILERDGAVEGEIHRFLVVARKPEQTHD